MSHTNIYYLNRKRECCLWLKKKLMILLKIYWQGLYANVIGQVIGTNEVIISHKGKIVAQIPTSALSDDTLSTFMM